MQIVGSRARVWVVAAGLIAMLVVAQALAFSSAPTTNRKSTAQLLGKTGFAYLGGIRTFAAAVMWNRIDPQFHEYFSGVPLKEQPFMVPKMRLITLLDPSFIDAYYITSYIVYRRVGPAEGIEVAREGLVANPQSGTLRANLAQLLYIQDRRLNQSETLKYAKATVAEDSVWRSDEDKYEGHIMALQILRDAGEVELALEVELGLEQLRSEGVGLGDHDHDGDGKQDH